MINFIHQLSKWAAILWTSLCAVTGAVMVLGIFISIQKSPDYDSATTTGASFFLLFILCITWFFPTLGAIVAMYFTRPQAWQQPTSVLPAPITS